MNSTPCAKPWAESPEGKTLTAARTPAQRCEARALRLLKTRDRSEAELRHRLLAAGFDARTIDTVVDRLRAKRFINDARVAEQIVHSTLAPGAAGDALLDARLEQHGIPPEEAAAARDAAIGGSSESARALEFASRWLRRRGPDPDAIRRRRQLTAALARRGFDEDAALYAVDSTLGPPPEADEPTHES